MGLCLVASVSGRGRLAMKMMIRSKIPFFISDDCSNVPGEFVIGVKAMRSAACEGKDNGADTSICHPTKDSIKAAAMAAVNAAGGKEAVESKIKAAIEEYGSLKAAIEANGGVKNGPFKNPGDLTFVAKAGKCRNGKFFPF